MSLAGQGRRVRRGIQWLKDLDYFTLERGDSMLTTTDQDDHTYFTGCKHII